MSISYLFSIAADHLERVEHHLEKYNEVVKKLRSQGYNQVPEYEQLFGSQPHSGNMVFMESSPLREWQLNPPRPASVQDLIDEDKRIREAFSVGKKTIGVSTKKRLGEETGWTCHYCHRKGDSNYGPDGRRWHLDHKIPKFLGGKGLPNNKALSCATCNSRKGKLPYDKFVTKIERELAGA